MIVAIDRAMSSLRHRARKIAVAGVFALLGSTAHAAPCAEFADVEATDAFCANVGWLRNRSITLGCTSTTLFCPAAPVNRLQMAAFMDRFGNALTPTLLHAEAAAATIDLDSNPVVCQTTDFIAEDFARAAYADASFNATAAADVGLAASLVMSLDGGVNWSDLNLTSSRGFVAGGHWGVLTDLGSALLDAEQTARWGLRLSRHGTGVGVDMGASRCHVRVRVFNRADPPPANVAPTVNAGADQTITLPATASLAATASDDGQPNPPGAVTVTWSQLSGPGTVAFGNASSLVTTASFSVAGTYVLRIAASDGVLSASDEITIDVIAQGSLPPSPESVATPPTAGVVGDIAADTQFLYSGSSPIQTGVAPGTVDAQRATVIRGRVLDRAGAALPGAIITILGTPALGQTLSRADGRFDLVVNGGGLVTLNYARNGFLPVQRQLQAPVRDYRAVDDVVMIPLDSQATPVTMGSANVQVHRASAATDAHGTRRATLLVPAGTTATLVMPNGTTTPVAALNVRATEYTVATAGPRAMPAALPPASGYTYAVELSADEALAAGAHSVQFNAPILSYVENFLGFRVGMAVPAGYYDRSKAAWLPSANGRVIRITSVDGGIATVDSVGTGSLPALALSTAERQQLASLYAVGQELWRVPVPHFTPWDYNWPFGLPDGALAPEAAQATSDDGLDQPGCETGSIVECENQALGENVPIVGTPYSLAYRSTRVPGRVAARTLRIPLTDGTPPASLKGVDLKIQVAGQVLQASFAAAANQQTSFTWDGRDAYGRIVGGRQLATIDIGYVYDAVYREPDAVATSFAAAGGAALSTNPARTAITLTRSYQVPLGPFDARTLGLGGWTIDGHQVYDPQARVLLAGSGHRRGTDSIGGAIFDVRFANADGTPAPVMGNFALAVGSDGTFYVAGITPAASPVRRITPDGVAQPFGSLAKENTQYGMGIGPDGSVYVTQEFTSAGGNRIARIAPDGTTTVVAGSVTQSGFSGDGGPATLALFHRPRDIAAAADGTLYIVDNANQRIRRIAPDGIVSTFAGNGANCASVPITACGDGGPATLAALNQPMSVVVGNDGSVYFSEFGTRRIRRVGPDGIISTVAGNGELCDVTVPLPCGDGGPATLASLNGGSFKLAIGGNGTLVLAEHETNRVRAIGPDGVIRTVAGRGGLASITFVNGMPAIQAQLALHNSGEVDVAVAPDGAVVIAAGQTLRRVVKAFPGLSAGDIAVVSADGGEVYAFDPRGRHLRTLHAVTGTTLTEFGYDARGLLDRITQKTGATDNVTTIEHDASGHPTGIVGPFGQRTSLGVDANGFLAGITNPAGEAIAIASTTEGLLTSFTDPRGKTSTYVYDGDGRLTRGNDAAGGFHTLARTTTPNRFEVTRATALGRTTRYAVDSVPGGPQRRTITAPDATQVVTEERADAGTIMITDADGTVTNQTLGPDPRFGMQAPLTSALSVVVPGVSPFQFADSQVVGSPSLVDPFGFATLTSTSTFAGSAATGVYTAATRTDATTSPAGRGALVSTDPFGRPLRIEFEGLAPATFGYDSRGRIATITRGSGASARTYTFAYDAQGYLQSTTDPIGRTGQFARDAAGRITSMSLADGRVVSYSHDAAGNVTGVTPPGRSSHVFGYSDRNELTLITPPAVPGAGATALAYNADRQITSIAHPDDRAVLVSYDAAGRRATRAFATAGTTTTTDAFAYDSAGRVASIASTGGMTTTFAYAGPLVASETSAGPVNGTVGWTYNSSFRVASQTVNGGNAVAFSYDADRLLVGAGGLAVTRDPQHGLPTATTLGVVTTATGYSEFGEAASYAAHAGATQLYGLSFVRDAVGRIAQKSETIGGVTDNYAYAYDAAGQLVEVRKNGTAVESYGYDANGNRTGATVAGTTITATYDAQDRLLAYGPSTFTHTAVGAVSSSTLAGQATTYQYDPVGNLLGVVTAGGSTSYTVDGSDRRVRRRFNGVTDYALLYLDGLRPAAQLDPAGVIVNRFVYVSGNVPAYLIRGGVAHRIITDQVGSVRLVVNATSGAIVQRIDYDAFGNVVSDSNPGFQPFGFAGGLYDPATRLVRFGARDYDPTVGRWTAKDPAGFSGQDASLYRYANNDPVNRVDPLGTAAWDTLGGFVDEAYTSLQLMNPGMLYAYSMETVTNALNENFRDVLTSIGAPPPPPSRYWHDQVHVQFLDVDRSSADYTKGELIAQCIGIAGAAIRGVSGAVAGGVRALEGRLARSAVMRASDDINRHVLGKAAAKAAEKRAFPTVEVIKSEGGRGNVNRGRNAASGIGGGRG